MFVSPKKRGPVKKIALAVLLLSVLVALGNAQNPADYTVKVHVSGSHITFEGSQYQKLDVVIDGKKYELRSHAFTVKLLALGDYKAKVVEEEHKGNDSRMIYEFLMSDNRTRRFIVVGQTE